MNNLIHIADRVLNRPLLIAPEKAQVILAVLAGRIGVNSPEASRFEGDNIERDADGNIVFGTNAYGDRVAKKKPYMVKNGVAIITITGSLVNRGAWVGANSGLTSYEGIGHQIKTAKADADVHSVILDLSSPGGEAIGAFETAALVRDLSAVKRTVALVNGMAASAAYSIASGASEIVTTETGVSGSIGVVLLHADFSRQLANDGIDPTLIFAGSHKVDGNPFEPLPDGVKADLQAEVNSLYEAFLKTVAKGRGARTTVVMARKTEARAFIGQAAVDAGLADKIGTFESVLADLSRAKGRSISPATSKGTKMEDTTGAPAAVNEGISKAESERLVAEAKLAGAKAERDRLSAVMAAEGIAGNAARMSFALEMAAEASDMAADKIIALAKKGSGETPAGSAASLANRNDAPDSLASAQAGANKDGGAVTWAKFREKRAG